MTIEQANPIAVGDRVQVGKGKTVWQVVELWTAAADGTPMAALLPDGGYTRTSVSLDRLTVIQRASMTEHRTPHRGAGLMTSTPITKPTTVPMHPGHAITVTPGPFGRAFFDCSCGEKEVRASKSQGVRAALNHHHDVGGCNCPDHVIALLEHGVRTAPGGVATS